MEVTISEINRKENKRTQGFHLCVSDNSSTDLLVSFLLHAVSYTHLGWAYPGGNAVNVAVYGRQLGMDTAYLGWIGTDNFGDMMHEKLKEQDVETVRMQRKEGKTAVTYIELLDGDRKFGEDFLNVLEGFQLSDEDLQYLAGFDCVHMAVWGPVSYTHLETVLPNASVSGGSIHTSFPREPKIWGSRAILFSFSSGLVWLKS